MPATDQSRATSSDGLVGSIPLMDGEAAGVTLSETDRRSVTSTGEATNGTSLLVRVVSRETGEPVSSFGVILARDEVLSGYTNYEMLQGVTDETPEDTQALLLVLSLIALAGDAHPQHSLARDPVRHVLFELRLLLVTEGVGGAGAPQQRHPRGGAIGMLSTGPPRGVGAKRQLAPTSARWAFPIRLPYTKTRHGPPLLAGSLNLRCQPV